MKFTHLSEGLGERRLRNADLIEERIEREQTHRERSAGGELQRENQRLRSQHLAHRISPIVPSTRTSGKSRVSSGR